jgi:hypothetical protein
MAETSPNPHDPADVAWNRVQIYLDKLFRALDELDEAGGIRRAAEAGAWKPGSVEKARASLCAAREALDSQIVQLPVAIPPPRRRP